jgi:hypothetical protein
MMMKRTVRLAIAGWFALMAALILVQHQCLGTSAHQDLRRTVGFSPLLIAATDPISSKPRRLISYVSMRGGSTSSASSRAAFAVGSKPQPDSNRQSSGASSSFGPRAEGNDEDQQRALAKDVLDAFLTRDSRNSFIGTHAC